MFNRSWNFNSCQFLSSVAKINENSSKIDRGRGPQQVILPQQAAGRSSRDASHHSEAASKHGHCP
jgi:hypothetical protein